jgi:predicted TPR repeat methyltransferase
MVLAPATLPNPNALVTKARYLLDQGRPGAARPLVLALRPAGAEEAVAVEMEARLLFAQGRVPEAVAVLDAGLEEAGPSLALYLTRADLRLRAGDAVGAATDAAEAVILARDNAAAKALLGRALLQLGRAADAVACLGEALAALPYAAPIRLDLAAALDAVAQPEAGEAVLAAGIALDPGSAALHSAALLRRIRAEDFAAAVALAVTARRNGALDACGFGLMGHALSSLGRHDEAADAYVEAMKLAPEDPYVRHLVASAGRCDAGERAPPEYVRALFDEYAERFDRHLVHLGYRVPGMVRRVLAPFAPVSGPVLDLGCGTGLLALTCKDLAPRDWIGVDLSPRMLGAARSKALYAELHEADLLTFLAGETRAFPIILAGDVLCYFGPLMPLLRAAQPRMAPGGRFIFTVERLASDKEAACLGRRGRYAHSEAHVIAAARDAGLEIVSLDADTLRLDGSVPVHGLLAVVGRAA